MAAGRLCLGGWFGHGHLSPFDADCCPMLGMSLVSPKPRPTSDINIGRFPPLCPFAIHCFGSDIVALDACAGNGAEVGGSIVALLDTDGMQSPAHSLVPLTVPTSLQPMGGFGSPEPMCCCRPGAAKPAPSRLLKNIPRTESSTVSLSIPLRLPPRSIVDPSQAPDGYKCCTSPARAHASWQDPHKAKHYGCTADQAIFLQEPPKR